MTTTPELEASLRQLFQDHEHLADDTAPERLAAKAAGRARSDHRRRLVLALAAVVLLIAGVAILQQVRGPQSDREPALPATLPSGPIGDALRTFEASWAAAQPPRITLMGPPTPDVREGETGDFFNILEAGFVAEPGTLPTTSPSPSLVRWKSGRQVTTPLMSARETFAAMQVAAKEVSDPCASCLPLKVTGATLSTTLGMTPQGEARFPVWEFTLQGSQSIVSMVAIPASNTVAPAASTGSSMSEGVMSALVSDDGWEVTVQFNGEAIDCPVTYTVAAERSAHAVALLLESQGTACSGPDLGTSRHVTVRLDQPLGDATIIDARQGNPIYVVR